MTIQWFNQAENLNESDLSEYFTDITSLQLVSIGKSPRN